MRTKTIVAPAGSMISILQLKSNQPMNTNHRQQKKNTTLRVIPDKFAQVLQLREVEHKPETKNNKHSVFFASITRLTQRPTFYTNVMPLLYGYILSTMATTLDFNILLVMGGFSINCAALSSFSTNFISNTRSSVLKKLASVFERRSVFD